jgi:hypothetical protein
MEHFYKNIQGYFNFEFLYSDVVKIGVAKAVNQFISQKGLDVRAYKSTWICDKTSLITSNINN